MYSGPGYINKLGNHQKMTDQKEQDKRPDTVTKWIFTPAPIWPEDPNLPETSDPNTCGISLEEVSNGTILNNSVFLKAVIPFGSSYEPKTSTNEKLHRTNNAVKRNFFIKKY
jgi:hypothetical protein